MGFRAVNTRLWRSSTFRRLSLEAKLLYAYLLTNKHSNIIGCYVLPLGYAADDVDLDIDRTEEALREICFTETAPGGPTLAIYDRDSRMLILPNYLGQCPISGPKLEAAAKSALADLPFSLYCLEALHWEVETFNSKLESFHEAIAERLIRHQIAAAAAAEEQNSTIPYSIPYRAINQDGLDREASERLEPWGYVWVNNKEIVALSEEQDTLCDRVSDTPSDTLFPKQGDAIAKAKAIAKATAIANKTCASGADAPLLGGENPRAKAVIKRRWAMFWGEWPVGHKKGKAEAERIFAKLMEKSPELFHPIMESLAKWKQTSQWTRDDPAIPWPKTWLRNKRWEDDLDEVLAEEAKHRDTAEARLNRNRDKVQAALDDMVPQRKEGPSNDS